MHRLVVPALVVALLAGGCGSTEERSPEPSGPERAPRELTPQEQALADAYTQGGETWDTARDRALADPALEGFVVDHLVLRMVRSYEGLTGPGGGEDPGADFERAQAELVRLGERSAPVLAGLLALSDGVVAALAASTLERIGRPAIQPVVPLTRAASARTRLRATELLVDLPPAGPGEDQVRAALVERVRDDPEWTVRAQAARALGARGARDRTTEPTRRALEAALRDPDPAVSEAAAAGLAELRDPLCVPALLGRLERAVEAGDLRSVRACQQALRIVTGGAAERDVEGWRRWWYEHRDALQRTDGTR